MRKITIWLVAIVFVVWLLLVTTTIFHVYIVGDVLPRIGPAYAQACLVERCVNIPLWVAYKLMFIGARTDVLDMLAFPA